MEQKSFPMCFQINPKIHKYQFSYNFWHRMKRFTIIWTFRIYSLPKMAKKRPINGQNWPKMTISNPEIPIDFKSRDWDLKWIPGSRDWFSGLQALNSSKSQIRDNFAFWCWFHDRNLVQSKSQNGFLAQFTNEFHFKGSVL